MKNSLNLDEIICIAKEKGATDIHLIVNSAPVIRINKELYDIENYPKLSEENCEVLANELLTNQEKEKLNLMGHVDFAFTKKSYGRFRANVFKQQGKLSISIRIISEDIPKFESLNIPRNVKEFYKFNKGLVLITGATGSGKSTTLASLIDLINKNKRKHIITIEDPIEYVHEHKLCKINQREVGKDTKSFKEAMKAVLREDPDVILVGEMRDRETISTVLTAAETGHLVFSTVHTLGAAKTIDRILDVFPENNQLQIRNQLSTVLKAIVSQELILTKDKNGLVPVCEIMIVNSAISNLIREGKIFQINSIIQSSSNLGMQSFDYHLSLLLKNNIINYEEASELAQDKKLFKTLIS
ncbi:type IV pili twitching motility protein PilT [Clostridiaceae bacterium 14S0207]|nr:type IV pili twitching motility protein PilT [Clostridiaceae bacterium 14S0207]